MLREVAGGHGPLMFHQPGGCCDGSTPMCFAAGEFRVGAQDVLLGEIAGCKFYIGGTIRILAAYSTHHRRRARTRRRFTLEAPEGVRFLTRSRVFTDEEVAELKSAGPPARAA